MTNKTYFGMQFCDINAPQLIGLGAKSNVNYGMYHYEIIATLTPVGIYDNDNNRRRVQVSFQPKHNEDYHLINYVKGGDTHNHSIPPNLLEKLENRIKNLLRNCDCWSHDKGGKPYVIDKLWGKFMINDTLGRI